MGPSISCLVVSRTAQLLNRLLDSLGSSRCFWGADDEVLCSWNGTDSEAALIQAGQGPTFRLAQRSAYHFAANMNALAAQARGDLLVLVNDDLVLDPGSLDRAIQILASQPSAGVVGGRLRTSDGRLSHAGILFGQVHRPYNRFRPDRLGSLIDANGLEVQESGPMPAVTGALMVVERQDFELVRLRESFRVCGEDVALCLDLLERTGKTAYYASDVTAIHDEKSTRGATLDHYDLEQVATLVAEQCQRSPELRALQARWCLQEADLLEGVIHRLRRQEAERAADERAAAERAAAEAERAAAEAERQAWLEEILEERHRQLRQLRLDLESTQQQVEDLLQREFRRQWPRRLLGRSYRTLFGWLGVGRRRS